MSLNPVTLQPLLTKADAAVDAAFASDVRQDPILGALGRTHSVAMSLTRAHGVLLEDTVATALRHTGMFEVAQNVRFPITEAARRVVATNGPDLLPRIRLAFDAEARHSVDVDLVAIAVDGSVAIAAEIKRGAGSSSGSKRAVLDRDLQAVRLLLRSFARQQGFPVDDVAVGIVDVFGSGGHPARLAVGPRHIDEFFRAPVLEVVEALTERLRTAIGRRAHELVPEARRSEPTSGQADGSCEDEAVASAAANRPPWTELFTARPRSQGGGRTREHGGRPRPSPAGRDRRGMN